MESSLAVVPDVAYHATWDAAGKTVSLVPDAHWTPDTYYTVDVAAAALDRDGLKLGEPTDASFLTASVTSGKISASTVAGDSIAPTTKFLVTFTDPVRLAMVQTAFNITPLVAGTLTGDDPTDAGSQVFTFTPDEPLPMGTSYVVSFSAATMVDAVGAPLASVAPLTASTPAVPSVVRFRPRDGTTGVDPSQAISVRFTTKMDEASTTPAFTITANGKPVTGKTYWAEDETVLVLTPSAALPAGAKVVATVSAAATSTGGLHLSAAASATFTVDKPSTTKVSVPTGGVGAALEFRHHLDCKHRMAAQIEEIVVDADALHAQQPGPDLVGSPHPAGSPRALSRRRDLDERCPAFRQVHGRPRHPEPLRQRHPGSAPGQGRLYELPMG